MTTMAKLREELAQLEVDLKDCEEMLELEPDDKDALEAKADLLEVIAGLKSQMEDEQSSVEARYAPADEPPPPPPISSIANPPPPPPIDETTNGRSATVAAPPEHELVLFEVKDAVMAKYSGDKQWYPAIITTRTGSSSEPVYYVSFKGYGSGTEKKYKHEVRAMDNRKRKAENTPAVNHLPASSNNGVVISAAPSVDPNLIQKREPSKVSDGPTRLAPEPKKLKTSKALDKVQNNWKNFQAKGPKKISTTVTKPKESQFRTSESGRVGFVGSGKPMKKDQARARWNYTGDGEDED